MKNYKSDDDGVLNLVAPAGGVTSGVPVLIGGLLVVPHATAAEGMPFSARYRGEFELAKTAANAPGQLAAAHWNDGASEVTTAADDGGDPATAYPKVGFFTVPAVGGDVTVRVMLTGVVDG